MNIKQLRDLSKDSLGSMKLNGMRTYIRSMRKGNAVFEYVEMYNNEDTIRNIDVQYLSSGQIRSAKVVASDLERQEAEELFANAIDPIARCTEELVDLAAVGVPWNELAVPTVTTATTDTATFDTGTWRIETATVDAFYNGGGTGTFH
tara:strand:+ start:4060 stop:4503 length:444 start_codon:yes stop_codon:yes gene_type:complete